MEVELALVLARACFGRDNLGHVLQRPEDGRDHALVRVIDTLAHLKLVAVVELALDAVHKHGEVADKVEDSAALLDGNLGSVDGLDLLVLRNVS